MRPSRRGSIVLMLSNTFLRSTPLQLRGFSLVLLLHLAPFCCLPGLRCILAILVPFDTRVLPNARTLRLLVLLSYVPFTNGTRKNCLRYAPSMKSRKVSSPSEKVPRREYTYRRRIPRCLVHGPERDYYRATCESHGARRN